MTAGSEPFVVPGGDHRQLLTKGQDLQMEEAATTEQASQSKDQRGEERLHREEATVREEKTSTGSARDCRKIKFLTFGSMRIFIYR